MKVGQYWYAEAGDEFPYYDQEEEHTKEWWKDQEWLFLLVATVTKNRKRYWLGIKCDLKTGKPVADVYQCHWFDANGDELEKMFFLTDHCTRRSGKRFLT
jgi:hypothetical protein